MTSIEDKKIAIVTGASRSIGFAISSELIKSGYYVVGLCGFVTPQSQRNWVQVGGAPDAIISADIAVPGSDAVFLKILFF